ncbi:hypothetical protein AOC36_08005 [Erysipelothrix larvae]|uniref:MucBP domain-containing protein n=1 Tax=Erysipelothrix larvae TaxID=1514105 RepID=A0A120JTU4_9FIRM|nr:hypothetical protein [Erysipelothrix larvae]AMC93930.1 hypothetical protein AOC36_08005 [Erysipelothrix larvae]
MILTRKKKATFTTGAIAIALLLSGSLAWQNLNQHKNNSFSTANFEHHIVLVENFTEVTNWKKGEAVTKSVAVRNGEDNNDTNAIYQDGFIRLQFKEYMEIGSREYVYTRHRYMIDTQGNFYRFDTKEAAESFLATLNLTDHDYDLEDDQRIEKLKGYFDKQEYYYIRTQAHDPNGQYGNYIVTGITGDDMTSIVDGVENHADSSRTDKQHDVKPAQNDQSTYTIKKWDGVESPFDEYVKWQLGSEVITLQEWIAGGKQPVAKWIIDTNSDQGYVYWGQALEHSNVAKIPSTMTPNFLESVTLVKQPTGTANYQINVSMDAVSQDDLKLWIDGNPDIIDMLGGDQTPGFSIDDKGVGDKIIFADHEYTIEYIDEKNRTALILGDFIPGNILNEMNIINYGGEIRYILTNDEYDGYEESYLKQVIDKFYEVKVSTHEDNVFVLPAIFQVEGFDPSNWNVKNDKFSYIHENGLKTAFALAVSDINYYKMTDVYLADGTGSWLRSPGGDVDQAGTIYTDGKLYAGQVFNHINLVRPALWISIDR